MTDSVSQAMAVRLVPEGLRLGEETLPLFAGSVHYWRLERADWRACLLGVKSLGLGLVDVYVPWAVHETGPGKYDFGEGDTRLDIVQFLKIAAEVGLRVILRPGPHINAELTGFGIPERVLWDPACQAKSPRGNPVMLPMLPAGFPVPSYASNAFFEETKRYFQALGPLLAPLVYPNGPIVLLQVDNEGSMYFRDGAYDQDYHPDAIALYREFLREKYGDAAALAKAYGIAEVAFDTVDPPKRFDAARAADLTRHLDWSEFHEHLLTRAMGRFAGALREVGLAGIPTMHNLPFGQETTPLNPSRLAAHIDLVALDYYHRATPLDREVIARRTGELAVRCEGLGKPAFAAEMGAGFPPFFPPLGEHDSFFTLLAALAYGLRGFNLYMAVRRDRWIGGPIDPRGNERSSATFYRSLTRALGETHFASLRRQVPVRLVTPRSLRRLLRVMHAFGPATGALFAVLGAGARERCREDDFGLGGPIALEGESFLHGFEEALDGRGVPFAHVGGEDSDIALDGAKWVICASTGGMKPVLFDRLAELSRRGVQVTLGPRAPTRDGSFQPLETPFDLGALAVLPAPRRASDMKGSPLATETAPAAADRAVAQAIELLGLPTLACDPDHVHLTLHEDAEGRPRVAFLINPGNSDVVARATVPGVTHAVDALDGTRVGVDRETIEVRLPPRTVRMLSVS